MLSLVLILVLFYFYLLSMYFLTMLECFFRSYRECLNIARILQITGLAFSSVDPSYIYVQGVDYEVKMFL